MIDHARLAANIRTTPAYPNKVIYQALEGLIEHLNQRPGFQLSITYSYPEEAIPGRVDGPMVKLAQKVGHRVMGRPIMPVGSITRKTTPTSVMPVSTLSGNGLRRIPSMTFNNILPPSNAGIGSKLTIPKFSDRNAKKFSTPAIDRDFPDSRP